MGSLLSYGNYYRTNPWIPKKKGGKRILMGRDFVNERC
jgi:hypothetical protein